MHKNNTMMIHLLTVCISGVARSIQSVGHGPKMFCACAYFNYAHTLMTSATRCFCFGSALTKTKRSLLSVSDTFWRKVGHDRPRVRPFTHHVRQQAIVCECYTAIQAAKSVVSGRASISFGRAWPDLAHSWLRHCIIVSIN